MTQFAQLRSIESGRQPAAVPLRIVTAASLFDGHDAAINLMRRLIQARGCEVIHLGHNRSVAEIVRAAICEDADAVAVSSYQGGHNEYFRYLVDRLAEQGAEHIQIFGGGGGTITPAEIRELQAYGVNRIYHPEDGMKMGLGEMIEDLVERTRQARSEREGSEDQGSGARGQESERQGSGVRGQGGLQPTFGLRGCCRPSRTERFLGRKSNAFDQAP